MAAPLLLLAEEDGDRSEASTCSAVLWVIGRRPTPSTQCGPKAHTLCSPSLSEARGAHSVTQVICSRPTPKVKVCPLIEVWVYAPERSQLGACPSRQRSSEAAAACSRSAESCRRFSLYRRGEMPPPSSASQVARCTAPSASWSPPEWLHRRVASHPYCLATSGPNGL